MWTYVDVTPKSQPSQISDPEIHIWKALKPKGKNIYLLSGRYKKYDPHLNCGTATWCLDVC